MKNGHQPAIYSRQTTRKSNSNIGKHSVLQILTIVWLHCIAGWCRVVGVRWLLYFPSALATKNVSNRGCLRVVLKYRLVLILPEVQVVLILPCSGQYRGADFGLKMTYFRRFKGVGSWEESESQRSVPLPLPCYP